MGSVHVGWVCETHPTVPYDTCTCGAPGMPAAEAKRVEVGCYIRPADASDDAAAIHTMEGTCWAIERLPDINTGELVDHLHVVHVNAGQLRFAILTADRVGSIDPPHLADLDSLLKLSGRELVKHGRKTEKRYLALIHSCAGVLAQPQHQPDVPSVFGDDQEEPTVGRPVCGTCGRPLTDGVCTAHGAQTTPVAADPVLVLVDRFERLGRTEQNEVRRTAREDGLPFLEAGVELSLSDQFRYQTLIARWERHGNRVAS